MAKIPCVDGRRTVSNEGHRKCILWFNYLSGEKSREFSTYIEGITILGHDRVNNRVGEKEYYSLLGALESFRAHTSVFSPPETLPITIQLMRLHQYGCLAR